MAMEQECAGLLDMKHKLLMIFVCTFNQCLLVMEWGHFDVRYWNAQSSTAMENHGKFCVDVSCHCCKGLWAWPRRWWGHDCIIVYCEGGLNSKGIKVDSAPPSAPSFGSKMYWKWCIIFIKIPVIRRHGSRWLVEAAEIIRMTRFAAVC